MIAVVRIGPHGRERVLTLTVADGHARTVLELPADTYAASVDWSSSGQLAFSFAK